MKFIRKENRIIANTNGKKGFILKLLNDNARYIRCKIGSIYRKLVKKKQIIMVGSRKITQNGLID